MHRPCPCVADGASQFWRKQDVDSDVHVSTFQQSCRNPAETLSRLRQPQRRGRGRATREGERGVANETIAKERAAPARSFACDLSHCPIDDAYLNACCRACAAPVSMAVAKHNASFAVAELNSAPPHFSRRPVDAMLIQVLADVFGRGHGAAFPLSMMARRASTSACRRPTSARHGASMSPDSSCRAASSPRPDTARGRSAGWYFLRTTLDSRRPAWPPPACASPRCASTSATRPPSAARRGLAEPVVASSSTQMNDVRAAVVVALAARLHGVFLQRTRPCVSVMYPAASSGAGVVWQLAVSHRPSNHSTMTFGGMSRRTFGL